ncbi:histidinol-phosphate transaminase [Buchnera aphidicola]|uniref:histidinol-phosphate transaminase n=1 Tax=Buchnera aphidicola TaxID=9 RepID=UPI0022384881|nr:histidinol-phosphate transaminase [Buchnera aphidicola]MCW5197607.1 histidinol-phosphate transaminase [Buchnera aphidicola (Chaitophorus viminalis)]
MIDIHKLVRKNIKKLIPYQSARRIKGNGDIWLNANESPFEQQKNFFFNNLNRYPDKEYKLLLKSYSNYTKISYKNIIATRGSDEAIELLIKAFCEPKKDSIMIFPPTYDMYQVYANILNVKVISILQLKNFQIDLKNLKKFIKNTKLIYLCNPNNPTGTLINHKDIIEILKFTKNKCLVVIDEAYIEFCFKNTVVDLMCKFDHLIILRTLSKAFGLASIRCGFILAHIEVINIIKKIIAPYPLSTPTLQIARFFLSKNNLILLKNNILELKKNKKILIQELKKLFYVKKIFSSSTNFILVFFHSSKQVFSQLLKYKVVTRDQNFKILLQNCIRISVGTYKECINLINIFKIIKIK